MQQDDWWPEDMGQSTKHDVPFPSDVNVDLIEEVDKESPYIYELIPEQQPIRARMCGFGDRYRRPLTPPPVVRLIVRDRNTGRIIPAESLPEGFILASVDLWDATGQNSVSSVSHSSIPASGSGSQKEGSPDPSTSSQQASQDRSTRYSHIPQPGGDSTSDKSEGSRGDSKSGSLILIGTTCVQAATLRFPGTELHTYFIFPDLSVRFDSIYRLRIRAFDLQGMELEVDQSSSPSSAPTVDTEEMHLDGGFGKEVENGESSEFVDDVGADTSAVRKALINQLLEERSSMQTIAEKGDVKLELIKNPPDGLKGTQAIITGSTEKLASLIIPAVQAQEREQRQIIQDKATLKEKDSTDGTLTTGSQSKQSPQQQPKGSNAPSRTSVFAELMMDPFEVYSAKNFPGMIEPTPLTKAFIKQGSRSTRLDDDNQDSN